MIYREYLVMRKALLWFLVIGAALVAGIGALSLNHSERVSVDFGGLAVGAAWATSVFAAIFGVALGNGSRESARAFWTMPVSRWISAFEVIVVDVVSVVVAFYAFYVTIVIFFVAVSAVRPVTMNGPMFGLSQVALLGFVVAVYGWSSLIGMIGRRVAYVGIASLPFLLLWILFSELNGSIGEMLRAPLAANPYALVQVAGMARAELVHLRNPMFASLTWTLGWQWQLFLTVTVVTCGIATVLWRHAEVLNA